MLVKMERICGRRVIANPDKELTALDIKEGDRVALTDHKLHKL